MTEHDTGPPPFLIAPIDIEVLRIGQHDGNLVMLGPMYDFSRLPGGLERGGERRAYISADISTPGEPFSGGTSAMPGIHLHWTLPEALRHAGDDVPPGTPGGGFPLVPNRWLVTRLVFAPDQVQPDVARWVVESDRLESTPAPNRFLPHPTVPFSRDREGHAYRYIGRSFNAQGWRETEAERFTHLTALGYGEPTFSSFYPNCWTVFGFHDDLAGLPAGRCRILYHVAGWYGGGVRDPLSDLNGRKALARFLAIPAGIENARLLCSGAVHEVEWEGSTRYLATAPRPLTCALGSSPAEALSVLVAVAAKIPELETGLNALQFGLLADAGDRLDAFETFAGLLHEAGFASVDGGRQWVIRLSEKDTKQPPELPWWSAVRLARLNMWQQALNRRMAALEERRRQLFADWYKYLLVLYESHGLDAGLRDSATEVAAMLRKDAAAILREGERLRTSSDRIRTVAAWIGRTLPSGYLIESVAEPRFWQPQDPTLMLLGDDTRTISLSGPLPRTPDGRLMCRLPRQVATKLVLPQGWRPSELDMPGSGLIALGTPPGLPAELNRLIGLLAGEAAMLAPAMQRAVARHIAAGMQNPPLSVEQIADKLTADAEAFLKGGNPRWASYGADAVPAHGLRTVRGKDVPSLPLLLHYELNLTPVHDDRFAPDVITGNFRWSESDDLFFFRELDGKRAAGVYSGAAMLARHGMVQLENAVRGVLDRYPAAQELDQLRSWVTGLPHMAQTLSGFGSALLMRRQSGQLRVADPYVSPPRRAEVEMIARAVDDENWQAPMARNQFNPLRAGGLDLCRLRIVDSFGHYKDYDRPDKYQPEVLIARSLRPRSDIDNARADVAALPARIVQPARLQFRWLSTLSDSVESNSHPATSPILGWVLIDNIDEGVSVFNAAGTPFGTILRIVPRKGEPRLIWQPPPGGRPIGDPLTALEHQNRHLRDFVSGLFHAGPEEFSSFQRKVRSALEQIQPAGASSNDALSLLLGRPLALVRAAISLELRGGAATDQSWTSFQHRLRGKTDGRDAGMSDVLFPVRLGGRDRMNDGLVAYWNEAGGVADFTRSFAPLQNDQRGNVVARADKGAVLVSANSPEPMHVTMLIDPRGSVHAITGILPVKTISVPTLFYSAVLDHLRVAFRAGPVLASAGASLSLPVPTQAKGEWSWYAPDGARRKIDDPSSAPEGLERAQQEIFDGWIRLDDGSNH